MSKTILLVDDDPNIVDTAQDILEEAGFSVCGEKTAAGALERLKTTIADLAILDLNLPDAKGSDLAVEIKKCAPRIAIILLTGQGDISLGQAQVAIDAVLTKPVNPADLIQTIRNLVDS